MRRTVDANEVDTLRRLIQLRFNTALAALTNKSNHFEFSLSNYEYALQGIF